MANLDTQKEGCKLTQKSEASMQNVTVEVEPYGRGANPINPNSCTNRNASPNLTKESTPGYGLWM